MRLAWYAGVSLLAVVADAALAMPWSLSIYQRRELTCLPQASTALAAAVVASAFYQRANFYSAMVHLAQSSLSLMVRLPDRPCPSPTEPSA